MARDRGGKPRPFSPKVGPARSRGGRAPGSNTYLLASGRAGQVDETSPLAKSDWLVVAGMVGAAKSARITLAAALDEKTALNAGSVETREDAQFDPASASFKGRRVKAMGAIILSETPLPKPSGQAAAKAFIAHIEEAGFAPTGLDVSVRTFLARVTALRRSHGEDWPDLSLDMLQASVADWLGGTLSHKSIKLPSAEQVAAALKATLTWPLPQDLETLAPRHLPLPSGRRAPVDWLDDRSPLIELKVQELYGLTRHISVADGRLPVTLQMLSPGGKPVATTQDLPSFWSGGYIDMAKDMRGRYPKHDWPDDPAGAKPHAGITKARLGKR